MPTSPHLLRVLRPNAFIALMVTCVAITAVTAPARAEAAKPDVVTPEEATSKLIGAWDATPAVDEIYLMAMEQQQDPEVARMKAIGARVTYVFGSGKAMRIVILSRQGSTDGPVLPRLKPRVVDAMWEVAQGPKGLLLKITPKTTGKTIEEPLTFKDDDAFTAKSNHLAHEGFRSPYHFRRQISERVTQWVRANNKVGREKAPLVADVEKLAEGFAAAGEDFRIRLGGGLTQSGKPTELLAFCEQLYIRELTDAEAEQGKVAKMAMTSAHWPRKEVFLILSEAIASDGPKFDAKDGRIDLRKPITGTVTYAETSRLARDATYLIRVSMVVGSQKISSFHHSVSPNPGIAPWKFSIDPPKDLADYKGTVQVFVDLCQETKFAAPDVVLQVLSPSVEMRFQAGK